MVWDGHSDPMFLLHCPVCGQRELRSTRSLTSFTSTPHGIEIAMGCSRCGSIVRTLTGARAAGPRPATSRTPAGAGVAA
jgi:C4-type Zn-finger protein